MHVLYNETEVEIIYNEFVTKFGCPVEMALDRAAHYARSPVNEYLNVSMWHL